MVPVRGASHFDFQTDPPPHPNFWKMTLINLTYRESDPPSDYFS